MREVLAVAATLAAQLMLAQPGVPALLSAVWVPLVWVVWPPLRRDRAWPLWALIGLGLAWDALLEPVVGPGGIAWSAAGLTVAWAARRIADRSPLAWAGAGALAASVVLAVRQAALLPLGLRLPLSWAAEGRTVLAGAAWCALLGALAGTDLPGAWRRFRRRRLR